MGVSIPGKEDYFFFRNFSVLSIMLICCPLVYRRFEKRDLLLKGNDSYPPPSPHPLPVPHHRHFTTYCGVSLRNADTEKQEIWWNFHQLLIVRFKKRRPAAGGELFNRKRGFSLHSLSSSPIHRPNMTEILFKMMENLQVIHSQRNEYDLPGAQPLL